MESLDFSPSRAVEELGGAAVSEASGRGVSRRRQRRVAHGRREGSELQVGE